jgi:Spy/CpxP family protein refolding chaperone
MNRDNPHVTACCCKVYQMKKLTKAFLFTLVISVLSFGCAGGEESSGHTEHKNSSEESSSEQQPYAGYEERPIKALSNERVAELLEGKGAGYALAGELNQYPGPRHVLNLAEDLGLTEEQEVIVQGIFTDMQDEVRLLGRELVDLEERLDQAFRDEAIDEDALSQLTEESAAVEGSLREAHLNAHLKTRDILSLEQVEEYDRLRGYSERDATSESEEQQHEGHDS